MSTTDSLAATAGATLNAAEGDRLITIRRLDEDDAAMLWKLRQRALQQEPASFAESPEELLQVSTDSYAQRVCRGSSDSFVFGAFDGSALEGMAGFFREPRMKRRHKGTVWGVYVSPDYRGQGVARAILAELLQAARTIPDLKWIALSVATTSKPIRKLYRSLGFRAWGIEPGALQIGGTAVDEEHMVLRLDGADETSFQVPRYLRIRTRQPSVATTRLPFVTLAPIE